MINAQQINQVDNVFFLQIDKKQNIQIVFNQQQTNKQTEIH